MLVEPVRMHDTRLRVLAFVATFPGPGGPRVRDVARGVGIYPSTALHHLRRLRDAGWLTWEPGHSGTIRMTAEVVYP